MRDGGGRGSDAVTGDAATEVEEGSAKVYTDLGRQDADLLRGQFRGVSEVKMLHNCLTRLGRDVRIVVGPGRWRPGAGRIEVMSG